MVERATERSDSRVAEGDKRGWQPIWDARGGKAVQKDEPRDVLALQVRLRERGGGFGPEAADGRNEKLWMFARDAFQRTTGTRILAWWPDLEGRIVASLRDALVEDLAHAEEACERTATRTDIWQDRIVYWMAVAIVHIITWILRKEKQL